MKLSKQKKRRVQGYLDMLEYNADCISFLYDNDREKHIEILETIIGEGCYNKTIDKKTLTLMEKLYHKFHLSKMEIYNPK